MPEVLCSAQQPPQRHPLTPPPAACSPSVSAETTGWWWWRRWCWTWTHWRWERGRSEGERKAREAAVLYWLWLPGEQGKHLSGLFNIFLSKCGGFQYLCKQHTLNFPLCNISFGLFFFLIDYHWRKAGSRTWWRISGCELEKISWTFNHILPPSYLPSSLWESCKQLISSPWTAVAPLIPTSRSLCSLTKRRSLTQRFTRKRSILCSTRPLSSR